MKYFSVEEEMNSEVLKHIQEIINSPLILSLATFALVAFLLILVGFCIVRKAWTVQWKDILDDHASDNKDPRKNLHPVHSNNEYEFDNRN